MTFILILLLILGIAGTVVSYFLLPSEPKNDQGKMLKKMGKPSILLVVLTVCGLTFASLKDGLMFNAEPEYYYHVTTWFGEESLVKTSGPHYKGFGTATPIKKAVSIQADSDLAGASKNLAPLDVIFLDSVTSTAEGTVRFSVPSDEVMFLQFVHQYRTLENALNTLLVPYFIETLIANAQSISAEDYFSGGMTEFNASFRHQMDNGVKIVQRVIEQVPDENAQSKCKYDNQIITANNEKNKTNTPLIECSLLVKNEFKVIPVIDQTTGLPQISKPTYKDYGFELISANVTRIIPNEDFKIRMKDKQTASATRAKNREERVSQEEAELLAVATGKANTAKVEADAATSLARITSTNAIERAKVVEKQEQEKEKAIIIATRKKEQAAIDLTTADTLVTIAQKNALIKKINSEAIAKERKVLLESDNGFKANIELEKFKWEQFAKAVSGAQVPNTVINGGGKDGSGNGIEQLTNYKLLEYMKKDLMSK